MFCLFNIWSILFSLNVWPTSKVGYKILFAKVNNNKNSYLCLVVKVPSGLQQPDYSIQNLQHNLPINLCDNPCRTGCITFAVAVCFATLIITMFVNQMVSLVFLFCKAGCLISMLLAWYWISAKEAIREATDAMFMAQLKTLVELGCCIQLCPPPAWRWDLQCWGTCKNLI